MNMKFDDFIKKLKNFQSVYESEIEKLPFHFNVIDELHANENAHSRILQKILQYKQKNEFTFLLSFLDNFLPQTVNVTKPAVSFNRENIDVLIEDRKTRFACIIENKIHWAVDQDRQIERYVKTVKGNGFENVFVIYLTSNGHKQISDISLTDTAKKLLNFNSENDTGNFICLNYRMHILPWLKQYVLNNCKYKDFKMLTGIVQYIDHLEGMFNIRKDKKKMNEELINHIRENFNIKGASLEDFERVAQCQETINRFQMELDNLRKIMVESNPWNQKDSEKASWLAHKIYSVFSESPEKIKPFSKIWIWQSNTLVFEGWNYKDFTFAIDVSCGNLSNMGVSILPRCRCSNEQYKNICEERFSAFFEQYGWQYKNDWRYLKAYTDISNEEELNKFVDEISCFLAALNKL